MNFCYKTAKSLCRRFFSFLPSESKNSLSHDVNVYIYSDGQFKNLRQNSYTPYTQNGAPWDIGLKELVSEPTKTFINERLIADLSTNNPSDVLEYYYFEIAAMLVSTEHHFPPLIKATYLKLVAQIYELDIFIETGTLWATTPLYMRGHCSKIYTIDTMPDCITFAKKAFQNQFGMDAICGESDKVLKDILPSINGDILFFLDGHTEKNTPILKELLVISSSESKGHVIVIDDLALFSNGDTRSYPSREAMKEYIQKIMPEYEVFFEVGFIILLPKNKKSKLISWQKDTTGHNQIWPRIKKRNYM